MIEPTLPYDAIDARAPELSLVAFDEPREPTVPVPARGFSVDRSRFFLEVMETAARFTRCTTVAVVERVPGRQAIRWLCGSGALTSSCDLDTVLSLLPDPHGDLQMSCGTALVPLGLNHAVIVVGADREVTRRRLEALEQVLDRLLCRGLAVPLLADVA